MTKSLVIHDDTTNTLESLNPNNATAVAIPAFAIGNVLPAAGQAVGEGFLVSPTKTAYLWDGAKWVPIVPAALITYPTDAALLADRAQPPGSYALAISTGNLYSVRADGVWRRVGVRVYATQADMTADTTAVLGDMGFATDTKTHYTYDGAAWVRIGGPIITLGATLPATGFSSGDFFFDTAKKLLYVRSATAWDLASGSGVKVFANTTLFPAAAAGKVGDTYFDVANKMLWVVEADGVAAKPLVVTSAAAGKNRIIMSDPTGKLFEGRSFPTPVAADNGKVLAVDAANNWTLIDPGPRTYTSEIANGNWYLECSGFHFSKWFEISAGFCSGRGNWDPMFHMAIDGTDIVWNTASLLGHYNMLQSGLSAGANWGSATVNGWSRKTQAHGQQFNSGLPMSIGVVTGQASGNIYASFTLRGHCRGGDHWVLGWQGSFISDDGTPMSIVGDTSFVKVGAATKLAFLARTGNTDRDSIYGRMVARGE